MLRNMTAININDVFTVDSQKGRSVDIHNRGTYGISFCYGGQITYYLNGKTVVSDRNHMVLLPQGQNYHLYCDKSGLFPVINIKCTPDFCITEHISIPIRNPEKYLKNFERLKEHYILSNNRPKCMSILYDILSDLAADSTSCNPIVTEAVRFIDQNYTDSNLTVATIASNCNISEVYLRRLFKDVFQISPKQYLQDLRLRKAKQLLSEGSLSIGQVAEYSGYSSVYHFSRSFHKEVGISPSEYSSIERKIQI